PAAGSEATAAGSAPVEIAVKSADGFEFKSLFFAPPSAASNAVLIVPDLGQRRDHFARLARTLQEHGYRVASMDNAGQARNVVKRGNGAALFTPMTTKVLDKLVPDVTAAIKALRAQSGVEKVAVIGFG